MYRNLEEDRKTRIEAADSASTNCECVCGETKNADEPETPAGNKTTTNLDVHYDING